MEIVEQLTALSLLIVFLFGITCGVIGGAVHGSRRGALLVPGSDDILSAGARVIYGVYTRDDDGVPAGPPNGRPVIRRPARKRQLRIAGTGGGPMRGFEIIAIVIGVFFVAGIAVGMLLVITLPLLQSVLRTRRNRRRYKNGGDWWKLSPDDGGRPPPRWPGS